MRPWILVFAAFLSLAPLSVQAAPTCQNRDGVTVRCGVAGAMPVGWTLPDDERAARNAAAPQPYDTRNKWRAIALVALLLTLFALLPEFDGRTDSDWDAQEGDDRR